MAGFGSEFYTAVMIEELRKLVSYNPETGELTWLEIDDADCANSKRWNSKFAGKPAFSVLMKDGYRAGKFMRKMMYAHRVAWAIHFGTLPNCIDHINGDRSDNRISNLREVSAADNARNKRIDKRNKHGATGVTWSRRLKKWRSDIHANGSSITLGYFDDFADALAARSEANVKFGFHPNHGDRYAAARWK